MKTPNLIQRAARKATTGGLKDFAESSFRAFGRWELDRTKKKKMVYSNPFWREINFNALNLRGQGKLLLNNFDRGFSMEFTAYGFREPLNTYAIYKTVEREKPTVLDLGSNLGYFCLTELQAGAKQVVAVEPVPLTFSLLSKTLRRFKNVTPLNMAISDKQGTLKLYLSNRYNVTSASRSLLTSSGYKVIGEASVEATSISDMAKRYPINMVRMDVEGQEYRILAGNIPDQIKIICIELHVIHPYTKTDATKLLQNLTEEGFEAKIMINDFPYGFFPAIKRLGLERVYKLLKILKQNPLNHPTVKQDVDVVQMMEEIPEQCSFHLILQR
jgi:FkbM family methyltransferase